MTKSKDSITLAKDMFGEFLSKADPTAVTAPDQKRAKAKLSGQQGGLKGGPARAETLSAGKRQEIAKRGARAFFEFFGHRA